MDGSLVWVGISPKDALPPRVGAFPLAAVTGNPNDAIAPPSVPFNAGQYTRGIPTDILAPQRGDSFFSARTQLPPVLTPQATPTGPVNWVRALGLAAAVIAVAVGVTLVLR